jgi:hypothetical protein
VVVNANPRDKKNVPERFGVARAGAKKLGLKPEEIA